MRGSSYFQMRLEQQTQQHGCAVQVSDVQVMLKHPIGEGFGLWANLPVPKRALRAHGLPPWGSSAPAHLTHPTAMQPAGGAHASSSSVDGLIPSVAELAVRSCCALVVMWGPGQG